MGVNLKALQDYVMADPEKCVGCKACELACFLEHRSAKDKVGKTVGTVEVPVTPKLYVTRGNGFCMPVQCRHCEDAPCMQACRLKAIERVENKIIIRQENCDGCKDCIMACPFGAIEMQTIIKEEHKVKRAAAKCDLCFESKQGPACVRNCKNNALRIVHVEEENQEKRIQAAQILAITQDERRSKHNEGN